jgi:hypothetical protein
LIGCVQNRFALGANRYELVDANETVLGTVESPYVNVLRFEAKNRTGQRLAVITKEWDGALKELFTDADTFLVDFATVSLIERALILSSALLIDLSFFENDTGLGRIGRLSNLFS